MPALYTSTSPAQMAASASTATKCHRNAKAGNALFGHIPFSEIA